MTLFSKILSGEAGRFSSDLSPESSTRLGEYFNLLMEWKDRFNLIGRLSPEDAALSLFTDSLVSLAFLKEKKISTLLDLGTGAGFPGLVIKIARPEIKAVLMDSSRKKIDFLRMVSKELDIKDISFAAMRAEEAGRDRNFRDRFDLVTAKGVAPLPILAELCAPLIKPGGWFLSWKGSHLKSELEALGSAYGLLSLSEPEIRAFTIGEKEPRNTNLVCFKKLSGTRALYPRTYQAIKRKPLSDKKNNQE